MSTVTLFDQLQDAVKELISKNIKLQQQLNNLQEQHELLQLEMMEKDDSQAKLAQQMTQLLTELTQQPQ
ncbi:MULTISPECIES: hypothetical protein [Alishewanella]|jgi:predicted RecB family endonuclease|uniref:Uncharacterized protein n=2 Tax=Alishewanella TaxID=111142 RepID=H3Z9Y1_9ALTE|nr:MULTISPECIES: hypothetical protein [Alishewanella]EHR42655.1 hypothetical protein AJE_00660 [Alishewanella jeotgali KCTC 22429]EJI85449.1 hypothetical protein AEST_17880 [Alishewanella aestuarii B11]OCW98266.1 hypothetical protein A9165_02040 [Alishewanella sp. HH-ZS]